MGMNNKQEFELIGKERKLRFNGDCLDVLGSCEAMCCRQWKVLVFKDEHSSGRYQVESRCNLTGRECDRNQDICVNLKYILKKKEDGSCIYLNKENRCSIYTDRPKVCRRFFCTGGWSLTSALPGSKMKENGDGKALTDPEVTKERFMERLEDDMIFVLHPLMKLKTLFYLPGKGRIIFVKKMAGSCGTFHTDDDFHHQEFDETKLLDLVHAFDSKERLETIRLRFCEEHGIELGKEAFKEIVWLLSSHLIIIDSSFFSNALSDVRIGLGFIRGMT